MQRALALLALSLKWSNRRTRVEPIPRKPISITISRIQLLRLALHTSQARSQLESFFFHLSRGLERFETLNTTSWKSVYPQCGAFLRSCCLLGEYFTGPNRRFLPSHRVLILRYTFTGRENHFYHYLVAYFYKILNYITWFIELSSSFKAPDKVHSVIHKSKVQLSALDLSRLLYDNTPVLSYIISLLNSAYTRHWSHL